VEKDTTYIDDLTGIYNRRYLQEKQQKEIKRLIDNKTPFSLVWVDIDHFKIVNDTYGHLKGDEALKEFARFLKDSLRASDTVVRYGGDEFVCVMPYTTRKDTEWVHWRILKQCRERKFGVASITISAGIAAYPDDGGDYEKLLKIADESLYEAKRSGRDQVGMPRKKRIELPTKEFIDRVKEKDQLNNLIQNGRKGMKFAVVKGNVGIGKTRYVREVLSSIRGKQVVWSNCISLAENITYYPIRESIKYKIRRFGTEILKDIPLAYKIEIGKLVPEVMEEIKKEVSNIDLVSDKHRLYESIKRMIEVCPGEKIVVIDNTQWIDKESTEVIKYVMRALIEHPITFIFIFRVEEETAILQDFVSYISREIEALEVDLLPFRSIEIKSILKSIIGEDPRKQLVEYVAHVSGGNPFFVEEIVRGLADNRYLYIEGDKWKFKEPENGMVPKSIEDVAMRKYRNLSKEAQEVLQMASIIGWFDIDMIRELTGFNEGHIAGLIDDISGLRIVKYEGYKIGFAEEISRSAIYKKSVEGIRGTQLHKRVAEYLEKRNRGKEHEVVEELAYHYYKGQDHKKGVEYSLQAGESAQEKYANNSAVRYYTWAKNLLNEEKEAERVKLRSQCLSKRAQVLQFIGDNHGALKDLGEASKDAIAVGDKKMIACVKCQKVTVFDALAQYEEAIKEADDCLRIFEEIGDKEGTAKIFFNMNAIYWDMGDYKEARNFADRALKIYREINDNHGVAMSTNSIGNIYFRLGNYQKALQHYQDSLKLMRDIGHKAGEARLLGNIGLIYGVMLENRKALQNFEDALEVFREIGDAKNEAIVLNNFGLLSQILGDYKDSLKSFEDALYLYRAAGDENAVAGTLCNLGVVYSNCGEYDKALQCFEDGLTTAEKVNSGYKCYILNGLAHQYLMLNNTKKAKEFIDRAYKVAEESGSHTLLGEVLFLLSEFYLETNSYGEFEKTIDKVNDISKEISAKEFHGDLNLLYGRYATKKKDYKKAEEYIQQALKIFGGSEAQLSIGKTYYFMGELEVARGNESACEKFLNKSLEIFTSIGAKGWREKVEKTFISK